jgi:hypothetical protein
MLLSGNLDLGKLDRGLPGITPSWGGFLSEASATCLVSQNHGVGVEMNILGSQKAQFKIFWNNQVQSQAFASWNDEQELTEYGACGIAIMLVLELTGYTVIQRAKKGTGVDYWLGYKESNTPFENSARLEVSGILKGGEKEVKGRVKKKIKQTEPSDGLLPAFVVVVEFSKPLSHLVQK